MSESLVDLQKALDKQAKTLNEWITDVPRRSYLAYGKKRLISVETVTAVLQKVLHEKTVAEEKNVEYAKLVAAQAKEYAERMGVVKAKERSLNKLWNDALDELVVFVPSTEKLKVCDADTKETWIVTTAKPEQWSMFLDCLDSWIVKMRKVFDETCQEIDKSFVLVWRKRLSELFETKRKEWKIAYPLKSQEDFNYRVLIDEIFDELMKELLAGSVGEEK
jgi:hypothetical protein